MNAHPLRRSLLLLSGLLVALVAPRAAATPAVLPDGRVTFTLRAPKAQAVAVKGLRHLPPQLMTKDADGTWSVTVGPLAPDLYTYQLDVDGATFTDPGNRFIKDYFTSDSVFEVPGHPPLLLSEQPVPHGVVHHHLIPSHARDGEVPFYVYTPPGYDPRQTYPVVVLMHGFGDRENAWLDVGRANFIADNLLAQQRVVPAVIVITHGHPVPVAPDTRDPNYGAKNNAAMEKELLGDVLPYVEAHYAVRRDAAGTAIVGLSMGGGHSLGIGLAHPERFGWVGGFSSSAPAGDLDNRFAGLLHAVAAKQGAPKLLWIGIGRDDFLLKQNEAFITWLDAKQVPHEWHLTDGAHEWPVWRDYLAQFLQKIFR